MSKTRSDAKRHVPSVPDCWAGRYIRPCDQFMQQIYGVFTTLHGNAVAAESRSEVTSLLLFGLMSDPLITAQIERSTDCKDKVISPFLTSTSDSRNLRAESHD